MDPEQSIMITCALETVEVSIPDPVTETIASTSRPPSGRYSLWKISTVNSGLTGFPRSIGRARPVCGVRRR